MTSNAEYATQINKLRDTLNSTMKNYDTLKDIPSHLGEALHTLGPLESLIRELCEENKHLEIVPKVIDCINYCEQYLTKLNAINPSLDLSLDKNFDTLNDLDNSIGFMTGAYNELHVSLSSITEKVSKTDRLFHLLDGISNSLAVIILVALSPILLIAELFSDKIPSLEKALIQNLKDACRDFKIVFTGKEQPEVLRTLEGHLNHFETSVRQAHEFIKAPVEGAVDQHEARGTPSA